MKQNVSPIFFFHTFMIGPLKTYIENISSLSIIDINYTMLFFDIQTGIASVKDRLSALPAICAALTIISLEMER